VLAARRAFGLLRLLGDPGLRAIPLDCASVGVSGLIGSKAYRRT
jgi:hypothetical protein